jgi:hypothetical protein
MRNQVLLNEYDLARLVNMSVGSIQRWRPLQQGSEVHQNRFDGSLHARRHFDMARAAGLWWIERREGLEQGGRSRS